MSKPYHDEDTLRELYYDKQLSTVDIGEKFDIDPKTVYYWMDKHDIETRSPGEGNKIASRKKSSPILKDKDRLYKLYVEEGKTTNEIAEMADTSQATVSEWLNRHEIQTRQLETPDEVYDEELLRKLYIRKKMDTNEIAEYFGCSQYPILSVMEEYGIERRDNSESSKLALEYQAPRICRHAEALRYLYEEKRLTTVKIAKHADCWPGVIGKWLRRYGVELRDKGHRGQIHQYTNDYGSNWSEQREAALERDGYECRICGRTNEEQKELFGASLPVHHIKPKEWFRDGNREIDWSEANALDNLITVCSKCHPRCERMAPLLPADVSV